MSRETYGWLARNVLAGFTRDRAPWWLPLAIAEGHIPNTWEGPVPIEEVEKLLCSWTPVAAPLTASLPNGDSVEIKTHKGIFANDDFSYIGMVGIEAATHTYADWLVGTVKECVRPDELEVSSAGMLNNREQAWIQIERPESAVGPDGIRFSPHVTLSTSLGGSLASQINQNTQMVVCDNTLNIARGQGVAFRHTSRSQSRLGTYRGVMTAIMQGETDFKAVLERLLAEEVSEHAFSRFLDSFIPIDNEDIPKKRTRSERKRQEITQLYRDDPRAEGWFGTAWGVVQAVNTWNTHRSQLRNTTGIEMSDTDLRAMRNYGQKLAVSRGESEDEKTIRILEASLAQ